MLIAKLIKNKTMQLSSNIIDFVISTHYIKHTNGKICFVQNRNHFSKDRKYIMFSATASKQICQAL